MATKHPRLVSQKRKSIGTLVIDCVSALVGTLLGIFLIVAIGGAILIGIWWFVSTMWHHVLG
jgi:hypothetical protein